ncbi:unnamed protein product [Dovyalis caffra]|uniref:Uncharacterized protein n=1 Tax=Dovyalis caffra TaxID=77055 RepID=A0AAV1SLZ5_9ROSI|nr:unnamed protein product [Dovyalis caffra]
MDLIDSKIKQFLEQCPGQQSLGKARFEVNTQQYFDDSPKKLYPAKFCPEVGAYKSRRNDIQVGSRWISEDIGNYRVESFLELNKFGVLLSVTATTPRWLKMLPDDLCSVTAAVLGSSCRLSIGIAVTHEYTAGGTLWLQIVFKSTTLTLRKFLQEYIHGKILTFIKFPDAPAGDEIHVTAPHYGSSE